MARLKRKSTNLLIGFGVFFLLAGVNSALDSTQPPAERRSDALACLLLGAPMTAWGVQRLRQHRQYQQQQEHDRLRAIFFDLVQQHQVVTALQFAIAANVSGAIAKQFLDEQAREFDAEFEVDDRGIVGYRFNPGRPILDP